MTKKDLSRFSLLICAGLALWGCGPQEVKEPELTNAKYDCRGQPIAPGAEAPIVGHIENKGGEFKGMKITIKGNAVSESVLAMPLASRCTVASKFAAQEKLIISSAKPSFFKVDNTTFEADLPDFDCKGDTIDLVLPMNAVRQGNVDVEISIIPIQFPKNACTTIFPIQIKLQNGLLMGGY